MSAPLLLSILTPTVPSRFDRLAALREKIEAQADPRMEWLAFSDNRRRTIGEKRDGLLRLALGRYVAFVDDDDDIADDYVPSLLEAASQEPDVITFRQRATWKGQDSEIHFALGNPNEPFRPGGITRRNAWHVCAWRRSLAVRSFFPPSNYGEDWAYAAPLCSLPNLREVHIPRVLHFYRHSDAESLAPAPALF